MVEGGERMREGLIADMERGIGSRDGERYW